MKNLIRVLHRLEDKENSPKSQRAAAFVSAYEQRQKRIHELMQRRLALRKDDKRS